MRSFLYGALLLPLAVGSGLANEFSDETPVLRGRDYRNLVAAPSVLNNVQTIGRRTLSATTADLTNDGLRDVLVAYESGGQVELVCYAGKRRFWVGGDREIPPLHPGTLLQTLHSSPDLLTTGDFNADGYTDVVAAQTGATSVEVLYGAANGLEAPQTIEVPTTIQDLHVGSLGRYDGLSDLVLAGDQGLVLLQHQLGLQHATSQLLETDRPVFEVTLSDVDRDGLSDVVALGQNELRIAFGDFEQSGNIVQTQPLLGGAGISLATGDFSPISEGHEIAVLDDDGRVTLFSGVGRPEQLVSLASDIQPAGGSKSGPRRDLLQRGRTASLSQHELIRFDPKRETAALLTQATTVGRDREIEADQEIVNTGDIHTLIPVRMGRTPADDLILIPGDGEPPIVLQTDAARTFVVNVPGQATTSQTSGCDISSDPGSQCTLQEAIRVANLLPGVTRVAFEINVEVANTTQTADVPMIFTSNDPNHPRRFFGAGATLELLGDMSCVLDMRLDTVNTAIVALSDENVFDGLEIGFGNVIDGDVGIFIAGNDNTVGSLIGNGIGNVDTGVEIDGTLGATGNTIFQLDLGFDNEANVNNSVSTGIQLRNADNTVIGFPGQDIFIRAAFVGISELGDPNGIGMNSYQAIEAEDPNNPLAVGVQLTLAIDPLVGGVGALENTLAGMRDPFGGSDSGVGVLCQAVFGGQIAGNSIVDCGGPGILVTDGSDGIAIGKPGIPNQVLFGRDDAIVLGRNVFGEAVVSNIRVESNQIGVLQGAPAGNSGHGIHVFQAASAQIVGNFISNNSASGIFLDEAGTTQGAIDIISNLIGGTNAGNGRHGIEVAGGQNVHIGAPGETGGNEIGNHPQHGITMRDVLFVTITNNEIGKGFFTDGNGLDGITLDNCAVVRIGDTLADGVEEGNLIDENGGDGIQLFECDGVTIVGNLIGQDIEGNGSGNDRRGIEVLDSDDIEIGLPGDEFRNLMAGNGSHGIFLSNVTESLVQNNGIGRNDSIGLLMIDVEDTTVGGDRNAFTGNEGNEIYNNGSFGMVIFRGSANSVQGNFIGLDEDGVIDGNGNDGLRIDNTIFNQIGPREGSVIAAGFRNLIKDNAGEGISVINNCFNNFLVNNEINGNEGLELDLNDDGVTNNDPGDDDTGPNGLANHPILTPSIAANTVLINGELDGQDPNQTYFISIFANDLCDPSGHGGGEEIVAEATVLADASGFVSFTVSTGRPPSFFAGQVFTALAHAGAVGTSEFSPCVPAPIDGGGGGCPEDIDDSGTVDLSDLAALLGSFGESGSGLPADINQNGSVDLSDLAALLAQFGESC